MGSTNCLRLSLLDTLLNPSTLGTIISEQDGGAGGQISPEYLE